VSKKNTIALEVRQFKSDFLLGFIVTSGESAFFLILTLAFIMLKSVQVAVATGNQ
jgi:hypothetical protein